MESTITINLSLAASAAELERIRRIIGALAGTEPASETTLPAPGSEAQQELNAGFAAPAAPAPAAPAPAAPAPAAPAVELDSAGLPWDGRIHSSSKAKLADGTWKKKRGVQSAVVEAVTAELTGSPVKSAAPAPAAPAAPAVPAAPAAPAPAPAAPAPAPAPGINPFIAFMSSYVAPKAKDGSIQALWLMDAAKALDANNLPQLGNAHPELLPAVQAYLDARIAGQDDASAKSMARAMAGLA